MNSTPWNKTFIFLLSAFTILSGPGCSAQEAPHKKAPAEEPLYHNAAIRTGAENMANYLPAIADKKLGLIVNQTSLVRGTHLADTLLSLGVDVARIFSPEHGFRGIADAGESVRDGIDTQTGLPVISLYGKNKKPLPEQLEELDALLFDIQDVGARFYTYISTLHLAMEAAAEKGLPVIVLDRPNPNGHYVAGPVLDTAYRSFVGMHAVPIVHGMTVGEYALMINGEGWLKDGMKCNLTVIACTGYDHTKFYELPVKPSPNLPNMASVYLYPALCLFEGTSVSVGRGTDKQFQVLGSPLLQLEEPAFTFTPEPKPGATDPVFKGMECRGWDFSDADVRELRTVNKAPAIYRQVYALYGDKENFFNPFFDKLAGGTALREAIVQDTSSGALESVYSEGLGEFKEIRKKYLLYPDFDE